MANESALRAGRAYVELGVNSQLERGIRAASRRMESFGRIVSSIGRRLLGTGLALGSLFIIPIRNATAFEEVLSKFNIVFNDLAESTQKWAYSFAASVGRARGEMLKFLAETQDLLVPIGVDQTQAAQMSQTLTALAVDVASFNNALDADVIHDFQSALTGSSEVMKKYGVIVNEAAVKSELLKQGLDPKNATEIQKVMARYNIILAGTSAAHGDAARTADSVANRWKALKAQVADLSVEIGQQLLPAMRAFLQVVSPLVKAMSEFIASNQQVVPLVAALAAGLVTVGGAMTILGPLITSTFILLPSVVGLASKAVTGFGRAIFSVMRGVAPLFRNFFSVLQIAVSRNIGVLNPAFRQFGALAETLNVLRAAGSALFATLGRAIPILLGVDFAIGGLVDGFTNLGQVASSALKALMPIKDSLAALWTSLKGGDVDIAFDIVATSFQLAMITAIETVKQAFQAMMDGFRDQADKWVEGIVSGVALGTGASIFIGNAMKGYAQNKAQERASARDNAIFFATIEQQQRLNELRARAAENERIRANKPKPAGPGADFNPLAIPAGAIGAEEAIRRQEEAASRAESIIDSIKTPAEKLRDTYNELVELNRTIVDGKPLLSDEQAITALKKAQEEYIDAVFEGARDLKKEMRTPVEIFRDRMADLNKFLRNGVIDITTYNRAVQEATKTMNEALLSGFSTSVKSIGSFDTRALSAIPKGGFFSSSEKPIEVMRESLRVLRSIDRGIKDIDGVAFT